MELFATRGYFFCHYCGSFSFPEAAGDDGIRILGENSESRPCAVCDKPLASALMDETHPVQYCRNCRGVLLLRKSFAAAVEKRRAWATHPAGPPVPLNQNELERKVQCPSCKERMTTHPYYGPGNVVIDSCGTCDLVWLDFGELKQIVDAPGKDRGDRGYPPNHPDDAPLGSPITGARVVGAGGPNDVSVAGDLLDVLVDLF
jgi:Zn-finger nucleic acid-binding protein